MMIMLLLLKLLLLLFCSCDDVILVVGIVADVDLVVFLVLDDVVC